MNSITIAIGTSDHSNLLLFCRDGDCCLLPAVSSALAPWRHVGRGYLSVAPQRSDHHTEIRNTLGAGRAGLAVMFDLRLGRFRGVVHCVFVVTPGQMGVMRCLLVLSCFVVLRCFPVVLAPV